MMIFRIFLSVLLFSIFITPSYADETHHIILPDSSAADSVSAALPDSTIGENNTTVDSTIVDSTVITIHSPSGAMWRSMLLPGWGQLYNRKYLKAVIIGGTEIGFLYSSLLQDHRYKEDKKNQEWENAAFYENDRNRLRWWITGLILYSMADAYVDGHLWDFDLDQDLSVGINSGSVYFKVQW